MPRRLKNVDSLLWHGTERPHAEVRGPIKRPDHASLVIGPNIDQPGGNMHIRKPLIDRKNLSLWPISAGYLMHSSK